MRIVVVSDIFGRTPALETLCRDLYSASEIIDPYGGTNLEFTSEAEAYQAFMANVGLARYGALLQDRLEGSPVDLLIGFSVGASVVWEHAASLPAAGNVRRAVCFYGSQIRHHAGLAPAIPLDCVLPESEPGFNVDDLAARLSGKPNVSLHRTPFLHGFMNELSRNFNPEGYAAYAEWLRGKLRTP